MRNLFQQWGTRETGPLSAPLEAKAPDEDEPTTITPMQVEVDRIETYDRNPRQEINPRYAEIKASIRSQRGLNNALDITRRPGAAYFMIRAGGNTRLQILKELWAETGDPAFAQVHCRYHPWTNEADVLTAHMIENELRGEMSLIDKALGVEALKCEFEAERGETLSRSALVRELAAKGYTISRRHLIRFQYAVEMLYPLIPTALHSGLGKAQIDFLRQLEQALGDCWTEAGQAPEAFPGIWKDVLMMQDGADFDVAIARQAVETRMAQLLAQPVGRIRMMVDAALAGRDIQSEVESETAGSDPADHPGRQDPRSVAPGVDFEVMEGSAQPVTDPPKPLPSPSMDAPSTTDPVGNRLRLSATPERTDRRGLRERNHRIATALAGRHGLADAIRDWPAMGQGFLIDLPAMPLIGSDPSDMTRRGLWWLLFSATEFYADRERATHLLDRNLTPPDFLARDGERLVGKAPDFGMLLTQLLLSPRLAEDDFRDILELLAGCRRLRSQCPDEDGRALWNPDIGNGEGASHEHAR